MRRSGRFAVLLALLSAFPVHAAGSDFSTEDLQNARRLQEATAAASYGYEIVDSLTTEVGPRPSGSPADRAAVAWAEARMRAMGLDRVYTQPVSVPHWVRGSLEARVTAPYPQRIVAEALGGSVPTPVEGIEAPVVRAASLAALKAMSRERVAGSIVFIDERMERRRDGTGYNTVRFNRTDGPSAAATLGAVALLIRSAGTDDNRTPHTGRTIYKPDLPRIPAAALANPDADLLGRLLARGGPVRVFLNMTPQDLPATQSTNVIGELRGTGRSDEIVLFGAHLDSWDLGSGALDDGAGVALVLGVARAIRDSGLKTKRTLRFVLFAAEENGLHGADAYAGAVREEIPKHVVALEADFGSGRVFRLDSKVHEARLASVAAIAQALQPLGVEPGGNDSTGEPDIGPLLNAGVPVLSLRQDGTTYFDFHHTANDTLERIDRAGLDQAAASYATTIFLAANMAGDFGRVPPKPAGSP